MNSIILHRKLVLERCQLYAAQIQAVNYLEQDDAQEGFVELQALQKLLGHLVKDLALLEDVLSQD